MPRDIRTIKSKIKDRTQELHELSIKKNLLLSDIEISQNQVNTLADSFSDLNKRLLSISNDIDTFDAVVTDLNHIALKVIDQIEELLAIKKSTIEGVDNMYTDASTKLIKVKEQFEVNLGKSQKLHEKSIEEQKEIQRKKRDLKIYEDRLKKEYKEVDNKKQLIL